MFDRANIVFVLVHCHYCSASIVFFATILDVLNNDVFAVQYIGSSSMSSGSENIDMVFDSANAMATIEDIAITKSITEISLLWLFILNLSNSVTSQYGGVLQIILHLFPEDTQ